VPAGPARRGRAAGGRDRSGAAGPGPVPARERQPVNDGRTRTGGSNVGRLGSGFVVGGGQCVVGGFVNSVRTVRSLGVALWRRRSTSGWGWGGGVTMQGTGLQRSGSSRHRSRVGTVRRRVVVVVGRVVGGRVVT